MGLLAQKRMLLVLICLGMAPGVHADEGIFHLSVVDYFGLKALKKENAGQSSVWVEPGYRPPQVVIDLLDDPNEQTAHRYLRWHRERLEKVARAQEVLEKLVDPSQGRGVE